MQRRRARSSRSLASVGLTIALSLPLSAAAGQSPDPAGGDQSPTADFSFGRPRAALGVRASFVMPRGGSDLFDFIEDQLTIDHGELNGPAFNLDVGIGVGNHLDIVAGFEYAKSETSSDYRRFVDNNNLPIEQVTSLRQTQLTGSVRWAFLPRGHSISRLAWIPRTVVPYAGAGGGMMWYEFKQQGDWVDFVDLRVFSDVFRSNGVTPTAHVFGGLDLRAFRQLYVTAEGRYVWASAKLDSDFIDFDPIDLAGFRFSAGINLLF